MIMPSTFAQLQIQIKIKKSPTRKRRVNFFYSSDLRSRAVCRE